MKFGLLSIIVLFSLSAADNSNYDADDAGWKVELDGRNQPQLKSAQLPFKLGRGEGASRNGFSPQRQKQHKHKFSTDKHKHTQSDEGIPGFPKDFTYQELELGGKVISVFVLLQSTPSRGNPSNKGLWDNMRHKPWEDQG